MPDAAWPKSSSWSVRCACVKRSTCSDQHHKSKYCMEVIIPMKAMSNASSLLARQGKYGRRPKVEMPEKTESACYIVKYCLREALPCVLVFLHLLGEYCTTTTYVARILGFDHVYRDRQQRWKVPARRELYTASWMVICFDKTCREGAATRVERR